MTGRGLRRLLALVVAVSLPSALVVLFLYALGRIDPHTAGLGAVLCLVVTALAATPAALSLAIVRDAIESLGAGNAPMRRPRRLTPTTSALARAWRGAEARGNEARARLMAAEAVIAGLPDPLILLDAQRRIVRANAASIELIGTVPAARDLAASLRNPAVLAAADAVLRGEAARVVEFSLTVPVEHWLSARFARIDGPSLDGAVAVLTLHDITALKRVEQMRADFIANAGHELKTPLASLIGFVETLRGPARDDAVARERFLGIMQDQAERMGRLVNDLLSLSRIELNEHIAPTGRIALAPVIEHVAATLELRAADRRMPLALTIPGDLPDVLGDLDELTQVFQNLLDNAIKYGRPATDISVAASREGGLVRVAVADCGDGIPAEHLPRLTERFYRVDTARSRELGGTGLGLAVVKHILNRHRGRLAIDSTLGQGSIFTVWLRAAETTPIPPLRPLGGEGRGEVGAG